MNICNVCGKPAKRTWCSQKCHAITRQKRKYCVCISCGTSFYVRPCDERKGAGKYCSNKCRRDYERSHSNQYPKIGRIPIHRFMAEEILGRPLKKGETVHHIDGNKQNNKHDNLIVFRSQSEHAKEEKSKGNFCTTHEQAVSSGIKSGIMRRYKHQNILG